MARTLLALMVIGSLAWSGMHEPLHRSASPTGDHRQLERFVLEVARRTPKGASIFFILPPEDADSGLANHRLRHLLGERQVATNFDAFSPPLSHIDYVAIWRGGRGTLEAAH